MCRGFEMQHFLPCVKMLDICGVDSLIKAQHGELNLLGIQWPRYSDDRSHAHETFMSIKTFM
jgi:hypothetical protein